MSRRKTAVPASSKPRRERISGPAGRGRVVKNTARDRDGDFTLITGVLDQPLLWDFAASLPPKAPEGAPRKLPEIFYLLMLAMQDIYGSFSNAEANLREEPRWRWLCELVVRLQAKYRPDDEPFDLASLQATRPITAQNFYDARRAWLGEHLPRLEELFEEAAARLAGELGYGDENGPGSVNNPTRERTIAADGKVNREPGARYRALRPGECKSKGVSVATHVVDKTTGEVVDARTMTGEAGLYMTGTGPVVGFKIVRLHTRCDEPNSSIVLAVRRQQGSSEADTTVTGAVDIKKRQPGFLALVADAAIRGTHIRRLGKAKLVAISPIAALRAGGDGEQRVEKSGWAATSEHKRADGTRCVHQFRYQGGRVVEQRLDAAGQQQLLDLPEPKIYFRANKHEWREYVSYQPLCDIGIGPEDPCVALPALTWQITEDAPTVPGHLNVAENIRAIAPDTPRYKACYGWREDSENGNNQGDNRKYLRRARSHRADWSHWNEIGSGLVQNGRARLRFYRALGVEAPGGNPLKP